ncbi:MAG: hypothetical protein WCJ87_07180 [Burkholderiales bacterium]
MAAKNKLFLRLCLMYGCLMGRSVDEAGDATLLACAAFHAQSACSLLTLGLTMCPQRPARCSQSAARQKRRSEE